MSDNPPPQQYVAYPRPGSGPSMDADKLQALADGYFGMNRIFLLYFLAVVAYVVGAVINNAIAFVLYLIAITLLIGLTGSKVARVGSGLGWSKGKVVLARVFMALNFFMRGIIGFIFFHEATTRGMKRYGIRVGFYRIDKKWVDEAISNLRSRDSSMAAPYLYER